MLIRDERQIAMNEVARLCVEAADAQALLERILAHAETARQRLAAARS